MRLKKKRVTQEGVVHYVRNEKKQKSTCDVIPLTITKYLYENKIYFIKNY